MFSPDEAQRCFCFWIFASAKVRNLLKIYSLDFTKHLYFSKMD
jgi:hypothetical protein